MKRIVVSAALVAILAACGTDAESREVLDVLQVTREAPFQAVRPVQAGPDRLPSAPADPARAIPAGSLLTFEVRENVSTSSHKAGDAFRMVLVDAASGFGGASLPAGTPAMGVVTEAHRGSGPDDMSLLVVRVASVEATGLQAPVTGRVASTTLGSSGRAGRARSLATVTSGSAAGAILGQILGKDTRSTVTGAAVGSAVGVVVAIRTLGGEATLGEGSRIVVQLDRNVDF